MVYFDKEADPIDSEEWQLLFQDKKYQIVKQTTLPNGSRISTVWIGISDGSGPDGPQIFETMIFRVDKDGDEEQYRYATEERAIEHHEELVNVEWYANNYSHSKDVRRWDGIANENDETNT